MTFKEKIKKLLKRFLAVDNTEEEYEEDYENTNDVEEEEMDNDENEYTD